MIRHDLKYERVEVVYWGKRMDNRVRSRLIEVVDKPPSMSASSIYTYIHE